MNLVNCENCTKTGNNKLRMTSHFATQIKKHIAVILTVGFSTIL